MIHALFAVAISAALSQPKDTDTQAWWATTTALSSDAMGGRDTGSADYERAAQLVAARFAKSGLKPAGDDGTWYQRVPMVQTAVTAATISVGDRPLSFLHDIMVALTEATPPETDAALAYRGYCGAGDLGAVGGKLVICHGTHRAGLPSDAARAAAVKAAGALGIITIADPASPSSHQGGHTPTRATSGWRPTSRQPTRFCG